jgi:hypothetical protein
VFDFGLFRIDPQVRSDRPIFHPTEDIHGYLAYALFGLIGLHALAALWHHFVRHDRVLLRMFPGHRITREESGQPRSAGRVLPCQCGCKTARADGGDRRHGAVPSLPCATPERATAGRWIMTGQYSWIPI